MRARHVLPWATLGGLILVGGAIAGPIPDADAHNLTGGSAQATCVEAGVQVIWRWQSINATGHQIVAVTFDRPVDGSGHTDTTVTALTYEKAGTTVSLRATARWEDGAQSGFQVTTTIPVDICPPATTTTTEVATSTTTVPSSTSTSATSATSSTLPSVTPVTGPSSSSPTTEASSTKLSQPTGPTSTARLTLPATGRNTAWWGQLAILLIALGFALVILVRAIRLPKGHQ